MKRTLAFCALTTSLALAGASSARADGTISQVRARFYSDYVHFIVDYQVYDSAGSCVPDQYGGYDDPNCYDYDWNDATVDVHVYRLRHHQRQLVHSESTDGVSGTATFDIFYFELHESYCGNVPWYHNYVAIFRVFDPITDDAVDQRASYFHTYCK